MTGGPLIVWGGSWLARQAVDLVGAQSGHGGPSWKVLGYAGPDDATAPMAQTGLEYLGGIEDASARFDGAGVVVAVRSEDSDALQRFATDRRLVTLVHPSAVVGSESIVGDGSLVFAGASIGTNVRLGKAVRMHANSMVGHDTVLGDWAELEPGSVVSGSCIVAAYARVGAGATVLERRRIGTASTVTAGACVVRDVADGTTVAGVPATAIASSGEREATC